MSLFSKVINRAGAAGSAALPSAVPKGFTGMLRRAAEPQEEAAPLRRAEEEEMAPLRRTEEEEAQPLRRAEQEEEAAPLRRVDDEEAEVQAIRRVAEEEDAQPLRRAEQEEEAAPLRRAEDEEESVQAIRRAEEEEEAAPLRRAEDEEDAQPLRRAEQEEEANVAPLRRTEEEDAPAARAMQEPEPLGDIPDMRAMRRDAMPQVAAEISGPPASDHGWQQPDAASFDPAPHPATPFAPAPQAEQRPKVVIDQIDVVIHDDTGPKSQGSRGEAASLSRMMNARYLRGL